MDSENKTWKCQCCFFLNQSLAKILLFICCFFQASCKWYRLSGTAKGGREERERVELVCRSDGVAGSYFGWPRGGNSYPCTQVVGSGYALALSLFLPPQPPYPPVSPVFLITFSSKTVVILNGEKVELGVSQLSRLKESTQVLRVPAHNGLLSHLHILQINPRCGSVVKFPTIST
jgi:hypothetical protein